MLSDITLFFIFIEMYRLLLRRCNGNINGEYFLFIKDDPFNTLRTRAKVAAYLLTVVKYIYQFLVPFFDVRDTFHLPVIIYTK